MTTVTGTAALAVGAARRDRIVVPVWVYALVGSAISTVYSFKHLYPTVPDRLRLAHGVEANTAVLALSGRLYNPATVGGIVAWRLLALGSALMAVMSVLLVVRHTRADEEQHRSELLLSTAVGRLAPLTSALFIAVAANAAIAVLCSIGMVALGLPVAGSIGFATAWLSVGICFAAVAAVSAQLAETSRAAGGTALAVVGASYLLRAVGDAAGSNGPRWLSWLSPIGWAQHTQPFASQHWTVLLLPAAFTALATSAAVAIQRRRDLGAGLIAARPGPPRAGRALKAGTIGLAWRLERTSIAAWSLGLGLLGLLGGVAAPSVGQLIGGSAQSRKLIVQLGGSHGITDAFLATIASVAGLLISAYAILAISRLHNEENAGHAETLLAGPVARTRWTASQTVLALAGTAVPLAVMGVCMGVGYGTQTHAVGYQVPRLLAATIGQLPAVWVITSLTFAMFAVTPAATSGAWGVLGACVVLDELGPTLHVPQWALDLSPFAHLAKLPGTQLTALPIAILVTVALLVNIAGFVIFRHRDLR